MLVCLSLLACKNTNQKTESYDDEKNNQTEVTNEVKNITDDNSEFAFVSCVNNFVSCWFIIIFILLV